MEVCFFSLKSEALDGALEFHEGKISSKNGVKVVMARLGKLYKKDVALSKFQALEAFEVYKRPSKLSISDYINEFEQCLNKVKTYSEDVSDSVLPYRILKHVNLKENKEQSIKATISDLSYDLMKDQLKKIFKKLSASSSNTIPLPGDTVTKHKKLIS